MLEQGYCKKQCELKFGISSDLLEKGGRDDLDKRLYFVKEWKGIMHQGLFAEGPLLHKLLEHGSAALNKSKEAITGRLFKLSDSFILSLSLSLSLSCLDISLQPMLAIMLTNS
jgi:hypothetical protein